MLTFFEGRLQQLVAGIFELFVVMLVGVALLAFAVAGQTDEVILVYGKAADATTLDPHIESAARENAYMTTPFYEGLAFPSRDGKPIPSLAASWEISEDFKTWTVYLREGITFHNGEPCNAEAVRFSYERLLNGMGTDSVYNNYADEESCKVIDDYTVRFDLRDPFPLFIAIDAICAGTSIVCPRYVKEHATSDDPYAFSWMNDHACGTGPFKLVEWDRGQKITYVRNDDYWGGPSGVEGAPKAPFVDKVVEVVIPDSASRRMALEAGDIDIAQGLTPDALIVLRDNPDLNVMGFDVPWVAYLAFDVRYPPFDDVRVRQAISYAINHEEIISGPEKGFAERLWSVLHNGGLGDDPSKYVKYNYDPERARQLLKNTDYPDGFSTELYLAIERHAQFEEEALLIQSYLKDIGIDVQIRKVAFPTQLELQDKGDYGMSLMAYKSSDPDPEGGVGWRICPDRETGGWDATHWEDPIAHNTTKGREVAVVEARISLYQELAIRAAAEAAYVPLYQFGPYFAFKKEIEGFYFHCMYGPDFWDVRK